MNTTQSLIDLNEELIGRIDALEKENGALRKQASKQRQVKTAAAVAPSKVVSEEVARDTAQAMLKAGALDELQVDAAAQRFMTDPEATHRILRHLLDVQSQAKTASVEEDCEVSGGRLASDEPERRSSMDDCYARMMRTLDMN